MSILGVDIRYLVGVHCIQLVARYVSAQKEPPSMVNEAKPTDEMTDAERQELNRRMFDWFYGFTN